MPDLISEDNGGEVEIICFRCKRRPSQIREYIALANELELTPEQYVQLEEGTYNEKNGHFCCTDCYIHVGMPATNKGWIAP